MPNQPTHQVGDPPGGEPNGDNPARIRPKFEIYGEEMLEKKVKRCGNSGRVYLPLEWVGKSIKVIRYD